MTLLHRLFPVGGEVSAVDIYQDKTGEFIMEHEVTRDRIPLDALVFADYQTPSTNLEDFLATLCTFDPKTNTRIEFYVRDMAEGVDVMPPILVRITEDGIDLIDGWRRVTALLVFTDCVDIDALVVT